MQTDDRRTSSGGKNRTWLVAVLVVVAVIAIGITLFFTLGGEADVDVDGGDVDIQPPAADVDVNAPDIDVDTPDIDVDPGGVDVDPAEEPEAEAGNDPN
jgi:hypothetical protein